MKQILIIVGEQLGTDRAYRRYIDRHLTGLGILPEEIHIHNCTSELFDSFALSEGRASHIYLFHSPGYAVAVTQKIAALLGTEPDGAQPKDARHISENHYCIENGIHRIDAVTTLPGRELPPLAAVNVTEAMHFFEADKAELMMALTQAAATHNIRFTLHDTLPGWTTVRITSQTQDKLFGALAELGTFDTAGIITGDPARWIIARLDAAEKTVTFAESCTGGLLSYFFTKESGASNVFEGALITYSNRLKSTWIDVKETTLIAHGAVSQEVVEEMSAGAMQSAGADYAIAVSGIAGPTGGTPDKPVGTVHVAVRSRTDLITEHLQLSGDRNYVQEQTVFHAVKMLLLLDPKTFFEKIHKVN